MVNEGNHNSKPSINNSYNHKQDNKNLQRKYKSTTGTPKTTSIPLCNNTSPVPSLFFNQCLSRVSTPRSVSRCGSSLQFEGRHGHPGHVHLHGIEVPRVGVTALGDVCIAGAHGCGDEQRAEVRPTEAHAGDRRHRQPYTCHHGAAGRVHTKHLVLVVSPPSEMLYGVRSSCKYPPIFDGKSPPMVKLGLVDYINHDLPSDM